MFEPECRFPNEPESYRAARNKLLSAEAELRSRIEQVAKLRRELPLGGKVPHDYVFESESGAVKMSELFGTHDTLIVYSFMYGPAMKEACPSCTSLIDGYNATAPHLTQRVAFVVVARSPVDRIMAFARGRNWNSIRLLSSAHNSYNQDYMAETADGDQNPMMNVFVKKEDGNYHFWGSELLFTKWEGDPRHVDMVWPLWNFLDMTPAGRGTSWYPALKYEEEAPAEKSIR